MKKTMFIIFLIVLTSAMSGCLSDEEQAVKAAYQAEFDKILPLNESIEIDGIYPTETEEFGKYQITRGEIKEVHDEIIENPNWGNSNFCTRTYDITFSDGKELNSLLIVNRNEGKITYMKGSVNRIIIDKSNSRISGITYK